MSIDLRIKYNKQKDKYYIGFSIGTKESIQFINNLCDLTDYGRPPYYAVSGTNTIDPECNVVIAHSDKNELMVVQECIKLAFKL